MEALRGGVTLTLYTSKLGLDLVGCTNFCSTSDDPWWCALTLIFTILPSLVINAYLLYILHDKRTFIQVYKKVLLCVAACLQLLPFIWLVWAIIQLCRKTQKNSEEIKKAILAILIIQGILECVPQLSLQSYVVMKQYQNTFYTTISTTEMSTFTTSSIETTEQTTIWSTVSSESSMASTTFLASVFLVESKLSPSGLASSLTREDDIDPSAPGSILEDWRYIIILVNLAVGLILVTFAISSGASYTAGDEEEDEDDEGNIEFIIRIVLYLFPFIGVGSRVFICGVLGTYNPGFWFIPVCSALVLSALCNYIIKKDKTWDERLLDSLFNTTGNFLTKSSIPASFAYFVPATVFFAIYVDNPLCIAAFSLGLICLLFNIVVAAIGYFLK